MKTVIEMAHTVYGADTKWNDSQLERLNQIVELARADEREACAKFFDDNDTNLFLGSQAAQHIRSRRTHD